MENEYKSILETEIEEIYHHIISHVKEDETGTFWESTNDKGEREIQEDIYSGISGIIIFLLEYYKLSNKPEVLHLISKSSFWLLKYCKNKLNKNYSFYTGRVGTVFTLIKIWKFTKNDSLIPETLDLIKDISLRMKSKSQSNDLLNGTSSTIMGLLFIYDETKSIGIKKDIIKLTNKLIGKINISKDGFFWDKSTTISKGLCGISHGSGGIGLVFLELGRYFNNKLFLEIARRSFDYENSFYNREENNWPDFRTGYFDKIGRNIHIQQFLKGNTDFFVKPRYISGWCHGAPGIGLTRIRAHEVLKDKRYLRDIIFAGKNVVSTNLNSKNLSSCLCHGILGNNFFFLEMYNRTKKEEFLKQFIGSCLVTINEKKIKGFYKSGNSSNLVNLSLFIGLSGVGYSFIQALKPNKNLSYLLPVINAKSLEKLPGLNYEYFIKIIINKYYPLVNRQINDKINFGYLKLLPKISKINPLNIIKPIILKQPQKFLYNVEKRKNELSMQIDSFSLSQVKYDIVKLKLSYLIKLEKWNTIFLIKNPKILLYEKNKLGLILYPSLTEYKILSSNLELFSFFKTFDKAVSFESLLLKLSNGNEKCKEIRKKQLIKFIRMGLVNIE